MTPRDYDAEREKPSVTRTYGSLTKRGKLKPYNELLQALEDYSKLMGQTHAERTGLRKLAWFLGMNGETHACEVIMKHAREPEKRGYGMYGVTPHF